MLPTCEELLRIEPEVVINGTEHSTERNRHVCRQHTRAYCECVGSERYIFHFAAIVLGKHDCGYVFAPLAAELYGRFDVRQTYPSVVAS